MRIIPIDFLGQQGALLEPRDPKIHDLAVDFCAREVTRDVDLSKLQKVWIAEENGEVFGVTGFVLKTDIPLIRATNANALRLMAERLNSYLADMGCRGQEALIHVSRREKPEQRCPEWDKVLQEWNAEAADRVSVKVR